MKKTVFLQALDLFLEFNDDLIFILMHLIVLIDSKKFFFYCFANITSSPTFKHHSPCSQVLIYKLKSHFPPYWLDINKINFFTFLNDSNASRIYFDIAWSKNVIWKVFF